MKFLQIAFLCIAQFFVDHANLFPQIIILVVLLNRRANLRLYLVFQLHNLQLFIESALQHLQALLFIAAFQQFLLIFQRRCV